MTFEASANHAESSPSPRALLQTIGAAALRVITHVRQPFTAEPTVDLVAHPETPQHSISVDSEIGSPEAALAHLKVQQDATRRAQMRELLMQDLTHVDEHVIPGAFGPPEIQRKHDRLTRRYRDCDAKHF